MKNPEQNIAAWTRAQAKAVRKVALPAVAFGLASVAAAIGQAWLMARVLARGLHADAGPLGVLLGGFGLLALLRAALGVAADYAAVSAGIAGRRRLRHQVLHRLLALGPALGRQRHSGELTAVLTDQVEAMEGLFARWVPAAMLAVMGPALVLLVAFWTDPWAGGTLLGAGLFVPVGMALSGIGAAVASRRQFVALARLQARFLDRVRGIATIVLAGRAEHEAEALAAAADELRRRTMRVLRVAFLSSSVLDLALAGALVVLALHYGAAALAGRGGVSLSTSLFALLLVPEFFAPLRAYAAAYQDRLHATGAAAALVNLPEPPQEASHAGPQPAIRTISAHGVSIAFENVHFAWDKTRGPVLNGLSFRVPAGETLILIGPSGAGKSTVIEMLLGFIRPDSGRVSLNGLDLFSIAPEARMRLMAWIGQQPMIFAGSLRENIRFARPEATDAEVAEAARAARVDAFAASLPRGLDTEVGEGGYGLSGGQAQRVAIARAFLKNAPVLLLDEPTAHLDPATEAEVLESLRRLAAGRTVILASHSAAAHAFPGRRLELHGGRALADAARGVA